jgi:hypothetical protein
MNTALNHASLLAETLAASIVLQHLLQQAEESDESDKDKALSQLAVLVLASGVPAEA